MPSFNRTILLGNLTRDPALKFTSGQTPVADFGLAVNHRFKTNGGEQREEVLFIDCTCFGKSAGTVSQYCKKGKPLLVEGRLKLDQWDDKQTGAKRSKIHLIVDHFQFIGARDADADSPVDDGAAPATLNADGVPF